MAGSAVDVVLYDNGETRMVKTTVETVVPLRLKALRVVDGLRSARRVMLLTHRDGVALRGDGHLDEVRHASDGWSLEIGHVHWEILERRRHVRVPVATRSIMRVVRELDDQPEVQRIVGTTVDMSISGAFVQVEDAPPQGALVEFSTSLGAHEVRTLAVVAHTLLDKSGIGLHFVEYLENARFHLSEFLREAA